MSERDQLASESLRSEMDPGDWLDIQESEFVDFVEGRQSIGFVFEHEEIGLHGFKFGKKSGVLRPVAFNEATNE